MAVFEPGRPRRGWPLALCAGGCAVLLLLLIAGGLALVVVRGGTGTAGTPDPTGAASPAASTSSSASATPGPFRRIEAGDESTLSAQELRDVLATSPFTRGALPAIGACTLPAISAQPQVAELQAFLDAGLACAGPAWSQAMGDRNLPWTTPRAVVYVWPDIPAGAACAHADFSAEAPTMCAADSTLYWPLGGGRLARAVAEEDLPSAYLADISEQLAVSALAQSSLTLYREHLEESEDPADPEHADDRRRAELQLRCLSAASANRLPADLRPTAGVRAVLLDGATWQAAPDAEGPTIPASASVRWVREGLDSSGSLDHCNTWVAPGYAIAG